MIYDCQKDNTLPNGKVYDADTGEHLRYVFRYDDETGEYWYYVRDDKGIFQVDPVTKDVVTARGQRRKLKFVPFDENGNADFVPDDTSERKITFREFL